MKKISLKVNVLLASSFLIVLILTSYILYDLKKQTDLLSVQANGLQKTEILTAIQFSILKQTDSIPSPLYKDLVDKLNLVGIASQDLSDIQLILKQLSEESHLRAHLLRLKLVEKLETIKQSVSEVSQLKFDQNPERAKFIFMINHDLVSLANLISDFNFLFVSINNSRVIEGYYLEHLENEITSLLIASDEIEKTLSIDDKELDNYVQAYIDLTDNISQTKTGLTEFDKNQLKDLVSESTWENNNYLLALEKHYKKIVVSLKQSFETELHIANQSFWGLLLFILIAFLLLALVSYRMLIRLVRDIEKISETVQKIEKNGVFNIKTNIERNDELGELSKSFDSLIDYTNSSIRSVTGVMTKVSRGDFSGHVEGQYAGDFKLLQRGVNNTSETLSLAFDEILQAANTLKNGTLDAEIDSTKLDGHFRFTLETLNEALQHIYRLVDDVKHKKSQIDFLSNYDALTQLPNRELFIQKLTQLLLKRFRNQTEFAVGVIDIDNFKVINDTLGHKIGDEILKSVSRVIVKNSHDNDFIARLAGDEFVLLMKSSESLEEITSIFLKIREGIKSIKVIDGKKVSINASVGVSCFPKDGLETSTLMRSADLALFAAKALGGGDLHFYSPDLDGTLHRKLAIEQGLKEALVENHLSLNYQPKVNLKTRKFEGVEALLRWSSPELGFISPAEFIPVAEEKGLILEMGEWVLKQACEDIKHWQSKGQNIKVAVNVSAKQFQKGNFIEVLYRIIEGYEVTPSLIEIEVTESMVQNIADVVPLLMSLRESGFTISMDDFGTGYSSLGQLQDLPVDMIKIDRAFVKDLGYGNKQKDIIHAIIQLSLALNMKVIAEGIETEEQANILNSLGSVVGQGYYFAKPMPSLDLIQWLEENPS